VKFSTAFFTLICCGVLLANDAVYAETARTKIAVLDIDQILHESPQAQAIQEKIANQFKPRQENITFLQQSINSDYKKLSLNPKNKKLSKHILEEQKQLNKMQKSLDKYWSDIQRESAETIHKQVEGVVCDFAKEQKITLVFNKNSVLYFYPSLDISNQIISILKREE